MALSYPGGSVAASAIVGYTVDFFGWDGGVIVMIAGGVLAVLLLTTISEKKHKRQLSHR